jgi:hypothetical protein
MPDQDFLRHVLATIERVRVHVPSATAKIDAMRHSFQMMRETDDGTIGKHVSKHISCRVFATSWRSVKKNCLHTSRILEVGSEMQEVYSPGQEIT